MYRIFTEEPLKGITEKARRQIRCGSISTSEYEYEIVNPYQFRSLAQANADIKCRVRVEVA